MASPISGGMFRQSKNLKSKNKARSDSTPLPPPVSSEQYKKEEMVTTYVETPSPPVNGAPNSKEEDHYGFLYSTSEKDFH